MTSLEALLASQLEGGEFQSTSEFTIDHFRAKQKLAKSQLPGHGLWLVKLVQAAHSLDALEAKITLGRGWVEFSCTVSSFQYEPRKIVSQSLSGAMPDDPVLFHLLAGLRGSIEGDSTKAVWTFSARGSEFQMQFDNSGASSTERSINSKDASIKVRTTRPRRWPGMLELTTLPLRHAIFRTADEFIAVSSNCWPATIPLILDGRRLQTRYKPSVRPGEVCFSSQSAHSSPSTAMPTVLVCRELPKGTGKSMHPVDWWLGDARRQTLFQGDQGTGTVLNPLRFEETWLHWKLPEGQELGGYLFILLGNSLESRVDFVCAGAVVDRQVLPWSTLRIRAGSAEVQVLNLYARVVLPIDETELDLSHFGVRDGEEIINTHLGELREAFSESVSICRQALDRFHYIHAPRSLSRGLGINALSWLGTMNLQNPLASVEQGLEYWATMD